MAVNFVEDITEAEFYQMLVDNPQRLKVTNVTDIRDSKKAGDYFFYIDFVMVKSGQKKGVSYGIKKEPDTADTWVIPSGSKLYPIMEYVYDLYNRSLEKITLNQADIHDALDNLEAVFTAKKDKAGNNVYYKLIPVKQRNTD